MVSVIMPVYNCELYIGEAIESVLAQTYADWELLLVDDASTDQSARIAAEFAGQDGRLHCFYLKENGGAAKARNAALAEAKGRYIAYLDADDVWLPDKLQRQLAFMKETNSAFTCCDYECIDSDGTFLDRVVRMPEIYTYEQYLKNTVIQTVGVMVDLTQVERRLLIMPDLRRRQDGATWLQLLKNGIVFRGQNEVLARYRKVPGSLSHNRLRAAKGTWHLLYRVEGLPLPKALWCILHWAYHASKRRIFIRFMPGAFGRAAVTRRTAMTGQAAITGRASITRQTAMTGQTAISGRGERRKERPL